MAECLQACDLFNGVKMILEYAQLLSTAHRVLDGTITIGLSKTGRKVKRYVLPDDRDSILYSATHINHPSAIWARSHAAPGRYVSECDERRAGEAVALPAISRTLAAKLGQFLFPDRLRYLDLVAFSCLNDGLVWIRASMFVDQ